MSSEQTSAASKSSRFIEWINDPMGGVIFASIATCSTLGFVLSGMWFISSVMS